jgi:hypothetical protein
MTGRARLSALHRGTRHRLLPRWLSPRTGFPDVSNSRVFCPLASSRRLSTLRADPVLLPADRGPRAARVRIGNSARGHRTSLRFFRHAFRKGALDERDFRYVTVSRTNVKRSSPIRGQQHVARIERQRNPGTMVKFACRSRISLCSIRATLTFALAEACAILGGISGPIFRQYPVSHEAMKRRIRPIPHAGHEAVLHRIEVNVVDVAFEIGFVANGVLPEPSLPKRRFSISMACDCCPGFRDGVREPAFDQARSDGEAGIARRQRHNDMHVIGQYYNRVNGEGVLSPRQPNRRAQGCNIICKCRRGSIRERGGKEECSACN